jgi:CBS domain-containing protein
MMHGMSRPSPAVIIGGCVVGSVAYALHRMTALARSIRESNAGLAITLGACVRARDEAECAAGSAKRLADDAEMWAQAAMRGAAMLAAERAAERAADRAVVERAAERDAERAAERDAERAAESAAERADLNPRLGTLDVDPLAPAAAGPASEYFHVKCYELGQDPLSRLMHATAAGDVPYDGTILLLPEATTVRAAIQRLRETGSSCAQVIGADSRPLGVLDVADATAAVLRGRIGGETRYALRACAEVDASMPMYRVVGCLRQGWSYIGVRGREAGLISQGCVVRWLARCMHDGTIDLKDTPFDGLTAADCASPHRSVSRDDPLRAVLQHLVETTRQRSIALHDDDGVVTGVISVSDVRFLGSDATADNLGTAGELADAVGRSAGGRSTVVSCRPDTPIAEVIELMVSQSVHMVVVVDADGRSTSVVRTRDLLAVM